jgi:gamma-glutamyltranspeptidase/glutathione hydrolase
LLPPGIAYSIKQLGILSSKTSARQQRMNGGNAIDAAVASAAVLSLVEPMNTGVGGDLFAIVYIAKEKKLYTLNASGMAPSGATLERFNALGYQADPENWGPGSGMPRRGIWRRASS